MDITVRRQRGISLAGMMVVAVVLIFVGITAVKLIPAYMHDAQIAHVLKEIANDPEMKSASVQDIKASYSKRANMNYITDITPDDLDINKDDGQLSISVNYSVKIPLFANITLLLDFNPSSK